MQVQFNTDHNIDGTEALAAHVTEVVETRLARFADRITRVEVHLSDADAGKGGPKDKRCMMEARLAGHQPVAVSDDAATVHEAIGGAAEKLEHLIESTVGRLQR